MVDSVRPLSSDPLRNFKFNVAIQRSQPGQDAAGGMARLGFMQMQGLGVQIEPLTYREGGDNLTTRKMPGQADFNPIVLSRGIFPTDFDSWYWMTNVFSAVYGRGNPIGNVNDLAPVNDFRCMVYINILDHPNNTVLSPGTAPYNATYPFQTGIVKLSFKLYSCWIMGLAYSDLDAGGNAVGIEQMTLAYEGFDMHWSGGPGVYVQSPVSW